MMAAMVMRRALVSAGACAALLVGSTSARAATKQFALAVMHFNIQYVEGGTYGLWPTPHTVWEVSDEQLQDLIVTQSLDPVLDLFAAHPTWGADIEMQGYMLDVIAARHPDTLAKIRALATSGQIEMVSFHYADQYFIAHAHEDWARSADLTQQTFAKWGVPLSSTVFCQEEQSGAGMASAMAAKGYSTLVFPKNLFSYQLGAAAPHAPLYQLGDAFMVTTDGGSYPAGSDSIQVTWTFVDDGEKLATDGLDPYVVPSFVTVPSAVAAYGAQLASLEASGYDVTTVGKYAAAVRAMMMPPAAPPLLDGTWQPDSTHSNYRWTGGAGLHGPQERDDDNQSLAVVAHRELEAAATIASAAGIDASSDLDAAWRILFLGEGSDATGVNPIQGEVEYGLAYDAEALRIARDVVERAKAAMGATSVGIDTQSGAVTPGDTAPDAPTSIVEGPIVVTPGGSDDRSATVAWASVDAGHWLLSVTFAPGTVGQSVSLAFPGTLDDIVYTPALTDAPVRIPRGGFAFATYDLPLSDGLVGLGGGWWVVEDEGHGHVAAEITPTSGDVLFHDDTAPPGEHETWVFHVLQGDLGTAAALAKSVNVQPKVWR
jgi:hypothetical protein